jgi:hypothetical protein
MQLHFAGRQPKLSTAALCWALSCLVGATAFADTLPNAGQLQQTLPTDRSVGKPLNLPNSMPAVPAQAKRSGGTRFKVTQFQWVGNSVYADAVLNGLVAQVVGTSVDMAQLEAVAMLIANHYRAAGYVVQTKLPTQDIVNGVVTIEINEAIFGRVVMDGPRSKRVHAQRIEDTILAFQPPGAKLNAHNIDRALAVLSDLAGIHVQGQLVAGTQTGRTDFVVTTQDGPAASIDTTADNAGARSTGTARVTLGMTLNSPLNRGDLLSANAMASEGSDYLRTAYRWPVGPTGWTMGLHASRLNYNARLTTASGGVNSSLQLTGRADSVGLETIYPLAKRNRYKLDASLAWDQKSYLNKRDEVVDTRYDTRAWSAGLQGQFADADGSADSTWQLTSTGGELLKKEGSVTAGRYNKLQYAFKRTQTLATRWSLVAALNGQASKSNLDASEKFYLGGMSGVRAYPSSEGGGSVGQLINLELRHRFSQHSTWFAFYDHGQVEVNPHSTDALNPYALKGYGLGYGFVSPQGLHLKAMVARRLGSNPNPTATGQDQDGSLVVNRFWLSASLKF